MSKCEIFERSNFLDFYTTKSLREGDIEIDIEIPYAYAQSNFKERSPFKTCWAYASVTDAYPEQWAYRSGTDAYARHKRKNVKFEKGL